MNDEAFVNRDRSAIARAIAEGSPDVPLATNPLLAALDCRFISGEPGRIRLTFRPGEDAVQGHGLVCGGIITTMLDFAMAFAVLSKLDEFDSAVSTGLQVAFLTALKPSLVTVESEVLVARYRLAHVQSRIFDAEGQLLATGQSSLALQRRQARSSGVSEA